MTVDALVNYYHHHHHPVCARQQAHKADTFTDQHSLSHVAALATFQLFHPALCLPLSNVLFQVVCGLPLALCPSGVHPNAVKQSFSPSLLSTCPNQFHLLRCTSRLISLISAISTTLLFVILCCHLIFIIRLRHWHWNLFSFLSSAFVNFTFHSHIAGPVELKAYLGSPSYSSGCPHLP